MSPAIEAAGLVKRYGETTALAGVDLTVPPGAVYGLLGPNGAGKTTAVRILSTLLRPDSGQARVGGFDVQRQAEQVRRLIGLTGQFAAVDEALTGYENLLLVARLLELTARRAGQRATELLERFGLAEAGGRLVKTYSGGMRRRLDVAASLVGTPSVLFLDEPDQVSHGICVLDHGRVVETGTPAQLKAKVGGQTVTARPADRGRLADVAAIVADVTGATPAGDRDGSLVSAALPAGTSARTVLAALAGRLETAGIEVAEMGVRLASLDEVFLALTGQLATAEETR